jgi:hypothetical protein
VRWVADEHQLVLVERHALDLDVPERPDETDLDLVTEHELEHLLGVTRADRQLCARVGRVVALQDEREDVRRDRGCGADRELAGAAVDDVGDDAPTLGQRLERALGVREERASGLAQPHPSPGAHEELGAERALEALDPRRQRGLGDEERLGRACHRAVARGVDERLELPDEQGATISTTSIQKIRRSNWTDGFPTSTLGWSCRIAVRAMPLPQRKSHRPEREHR